MLTQETPRIPTRAIPSTTTEAEQSALWSLMAEPETAVSDAPLFTPEAKGALLLLLLLSPKGPKDK